MKFAVELVTKQSGRIGNLTKTGFDSKTPLVLHYTKVASVPHLSREVFDMITDEKQGILVSLESSRPLEGALNVFQKGINSFAGLDHTFSFVTLRDTGTKTAVQHSQSAVSISSRSGEVLLTPKNFISLIETFKPDLFHTLCDGNTNEASGNKRIFNSVNRTKNFFEDCAALYISSTGLSESMLLAPIEGGYSEQYRQAAIKSINSYENQDIIGGYFLDGFHINGESAHQIDAAKVCSIVENCIPQLPINKLRVMFGAYSPAVVIQLIQQGVDVFDTTYPYLFCMNNQALTFNFNVNKDSDDTQCFAINLSDSIYKDQFKPFVEGCECLACRNHTRAYVHHLLNTNELLSSILLMIHNTHHYLEFFKTIRQHIACDTLPQLLSIVSEQQTKYEQETAEQIKKQSDAEEISSISSESNPSPLKKLKNVAND